jgi:hypothetical protein
MLHLIYFRKRPHQVAACDRKGFSPGKAIPSVVKIVVDALIARWVNQE